MGYPYEIAIGNLDATTRRQIGNACHGYTVYEVDYALIDTEDAEIELYASETAEVVAQSRMDMIAELLGEDPATWDGPDVLADLEDHPFNADEA